MPISINKPIKAGSDNKVPVSNIKPNAPPADNGTAAIVESPGALYRGGAEQ